MASDNTWQEESKDAWIDGKAEATLLFNTELNSFEIDTDVENGNVTLRGEVESEMDKALAASVVREIDGVISVENMLTVQNQVTADMDDLDDMDELTDESRTAMSSNVDGINEQSRAAMNKRDHKMNKMDGTDDGAYSAMGKNQHSMDATARMDGTRGGTTIADTNISESVKSRLLRESNLSSRSINVDVDNRVVTLKGTVKSESERELALTIAKDTDNVDSVNDELTLDSEY